MASTVPFWLAFGATVVLLVITLITGWQRRRKLHLLVGPLTVVALTVAIVMTERLMKNYTFPEETKVIHLPFAKAGGLLVLPVVVTGVWLMFRERARVWHKIAVAVWLLAVLAATGTGVWMFVQGVAKTA
jgi:hypothetical protein